MIKARSPIVAVLGHVDHGKTSLLDRIRNTNVVSREAGGITQSIGAWQAEAKEGKKITFIDTPGHQAFQAMRSRGASVADIAILVVAADDGIMPQTKESIRYIDEAQTPFLVAITKVDLPTAQPERVKNQLLSEGVLLEGYGGDVVAVEVSSKTGQGIDDLLEMILLLAEVNEIKADPNGEFEAVVIESKLDRRKGVVAHIVVHNGTLKIGDMVSADGTYGKVRGLFDENWKPLKEVLPGMPAEILGFSQIPVVGSVVTLGAGEKKEAAQKSQISRQARKEDILSVIVKADTFGSLEAIEAQLKDRVEIIFSDVGDISESDVLNADSVKAIIVGFNVKASKEVERQAEENDVKIHIYKIIYQMLADIEKWAKEMEEFKREKILGRAQILAAFPHGKEKIAGCRMLEGRITGSDRLRLVRGKDVIGEMRPTSIRKNKEKVEKVGNGEEFGVVLVPQFDFKPGDVIESWQPPQR